jgi:hypothetical protein
MHTEHLHQTLSPQAYAALLDSLQRQAMQERRLAVQAFGQTWPRQLWPWWLRAQRQRHAVFPTHPQKA